MKKSSEKKVEFDLLRLLEQRITREEKDLVFFYDKKYTSSEVVRSYRAVASFLSESGIKKGDVVAVYMLNRPELLFAIFGSWLVGATVTLINTQLKSEEVCYQISDSGAKALLYEESLAERVEEAISNLGRDVVRAVVVDGEEKRGVKSFSEILASDLALPESQVPEDLFIIYTSGTTGSPKGAILSSWNVYREALQLQQAMVMEGSDRMIVVLPLFHVNNLMLSMSLLMKGGTLVILKRFDVGEFVEYSHKYSPTFFSGVPTVYKMLIDSYNEIERSYLSSLKFGICGAAPMPTKWFEDFEKLFGITIVEGYGLTEGTVASTANPRFGKRKVGSIGTPLQGQDVRIFGENDVELPPGEVGEIVIRGPNVMKGYLNREAETNETLSNGWLHSGDLGYMDDDGYFYIVDRKKDMINSGGEKVYPKEVENVLARLEGVSEAAVVGRPDEKYGEEVVAFIVKNDKTLTEGNVSEFCKKHIASYKCPKEILFVDALPRNSIGKILKGELRKRLIRQTVEKFVHV